MSGELIVAALAELGRAKIIQPDEAAGMPTVGFGQPTSTARVQRSRMRAAWAVGPLTLDESHAEWLRSLIPPDGTALDTLRRLIREEAARKQATP